MASSNLPSFDNDSPSHNSFNLPLKYQLSIWFGFILIAWSKQEIASVYCIGLYNDNSNLNSFNLPYDY